MLRVVVICAVALGCHLIVAAADSDIIDEDPPENQTFVKEFTTKRPKKEQRPAVAEKGQTDVIHDDNIKNETLVIKAATIQQERKSRIKIEDEDTTDVNYDSNLKNETFVVKARTPQQERKPRIEIADEDPPEQIFCSRPPDIDGVISPDLESDEHPLGTVVSYQCKFGYVSRSSGRLLSVCRKDRHSGKAEWSYPNTTCIPRSCGDPGYVINGRRIGNLFTFPNSVKFECLEGYKLQGLKERYCQASGEWSGRLPMCVPIYCPVPTNPKNGRVIYSSLDYGSELDYECDKGFMLQRHPPRICSEDGIWSNDEPECIEATCIIPEVPEDVSVQFSENPPKAGTLAFYSCKEDATVVGASTSKCLSSGDWTFDPPKCLRSCYVPEIQDGELGRNQWKTRFSQEFVPLRKGQSVKHHELVTLRCNDGYSPRNRANDRMQEVECNDGDWSESLTCITTVCDEEPPPVENASPVIERRGHGNGIWYKCHSGYGKEKTGNVVCQYGKWEGPTPVCADHRCYLKDLNYPGLLKPPVSFKKDREQFKLDCDRAYTVTSWKKHISCFKGKWDITRNPCALKSCEDEPPSIFNGQPREFTRVNGSFVDYECEGGYELKGNSSVHCAFGTWEGNPPICEPLRRNLETTTEKQLENESVVANALKSNPFQLKECFCTFDYRTDLIDAYWRNSKIDRHTKIKTGEKVTFSCPYPNTHIIWPIGLRLEQRMDLICDRCQDWKTSDLPWCETATAGDSFIAYDNNNPLKFLPGGKIEVSQSERISFACINRFLLPQWGFRPTERIIFRNYHNSVGHTGYYREDIIIEEMDFEHTGKYVCFATMNNERMRHTVVDLVIAAFDVVCPELSTETNEFEIVFSNQRKVLSTARYTCKDPLKKIVGSNERVCLENGEWSHNLPACEDIRCPLLNENNVLSIHYNNNRKVNSQAFYYCQVYQRLIGSRNRTCLHSGEWSGTNPVCEDITCPELLKYNGLSVTYSKGTKVGSIAYFMCLNHATLNGKRQIHCLDNGAWSDPQPSCEMLETLCPKIKGNGTFTIKYSNNRKVNSTAQFFCKAPDKKVSGCNFVTCQQNGEWSGDYPICVDYVSCDLFTTSRNLTVQYTDTGSVGSTAFFHCLPPTTLVGNSSARCLTNGLWSHPAPTCAPPNCSIEFLENSLPENLHINWENITDMYVVPGTDLPLTCEEHLVMTGRSKAHCNFHGKWEFTDTQCIPACRVNKEETSHLIVEPEKDYYRFGEFILLSCPSGLRLTSDVQRIMCLDRTWSDTLPDCTELPESNVPGITRTTRKT